MKINNKIAFIPIEEIWFDPDFENCLFSLKILRDIKLDVNKPFCQKFKKYTLITNLEDSLENIWSQICKNTRNEINKCKRIEEVEWSSNRIKPQEIVKFYNSYFAPYKKLPPLTIRRINKFGNNLFTIEGKLNKEITNIQVYLLDSKMGICRLLYSISTLYVECSQERRRKIGYLNKFLHWKAIEIFKKMGFSKLNWGGYSKSEKLKGVNHFKKCFGGEIVELYDYYSFPLSIVIAVRKLIDSLLERK